MVVVLVVAVNFVSAASFDVGDRWTSIQDAIGSTASVFSLTDRRPKVQLLPIKGVCRGNSRGADRMLVGGGCACRVVTAANP